MKSSAGPSPLASPHSSKGFSSPHSYEGRVGSKGSSPHSAPRPLAPKPLTPFPRLRIATPKFELAEMKKEAKAEKEKKKKTPAMRHRTDVLQDQIEQKHASLVERGIIPPDKEVRGVEGKKNFAGIAARGESVQEEVRFIINVIIV